MLLNILEQEWFTIVLKALAIGLAGLITWAFTLFQAWLNTKIKNEKLKAVLDAALEIIQKSVLAIQQSFVSQLKNDGKFDEDKQKEAFRKAYQLAITSISDESKKLIEANFGDLEQWLTTQIEAFVGSLSGHSENQTRIE